MIGYKYLVYLYLVKWASSFSCCGLKEEKPMMKIKKLASIVTLCSILSMGAAAFAPQTVDAAPHHGPRIERRMPPPPRRIEHIVN